MHKILIESFTKINQTYFNNEYVLIPQLFNHFFGKFEETIHTEADLGKLICSYHEFFKFHKLSLKHSDYYKVSSKTNDITKAQEILFDEVLNESFYNEILKTFCVFKKEQIEGVNIFSKKEYNDFVHQLTQDKKIIDYIHKCFDNALLFLSKWHESLGQNLQQYYEDKLNIENPLIKTSSVKMILTQLLVINQYCYDINLTFNFNSKTFIHFFSESINVDKNKLSSDIKEEILLAKVENRTHYFTNINNLINYYFNSDIITAILSEDPYCYLTNQWLDKIPSSSIDENSFSYLSNDLMAIKQGVREQLGFKVLLHGIAGTGKTELSKIIAKQAGKNLYRLHLNDYDIECSIKPEEFLFYKIQQISSFASLFKGNDFILVFDECEEFFENDNKFKEKITNILETLELPCIFIANDIKKFHSAYLRRFSYHLNVDICDYNQKKLMINIHLNSNQFDKRLYTNEIVDYIANQSVTNADLYDNIVFYQSTKNLNFLRQKIENKQITQDIMQLNNIEQSMYNFISPETNEYDFGKIVGYKEEKKLLMALHHYLGNREQYQHLNIHIPHGSILFGDPGTGKTSIIKALAKKCNLPVLNVSTGMMTNDENGALHIKKIFNLAKKNSPCIILLDEFEKMALDRRLEMKNGTSQSLMNQLLIEMDSLHQNNLDVFIYATCNTVNYIDPAICRSGRLEQMIEIGLPPAATREKMLLNLLGKECKVRSLKQIVEHTTGLSFVDLQSIVNTYKISLLQHGKNAKKQNLLFKAIHDFSLGSISNLSLEQDEKKLVAYHESGHAFLAYLFDKSVGNISIIPKSGSLGTTLVLHNELKNLNTKADIEHDLMILMAGRAAENIFLQKETNGSGNDFDRATNLVMRNLNILAKDELGLLYPNLLRYSEELSETYKVKVEVTINQILDSLYEKTKEILENGRDEIESLVKILMRNEEMIQPEMEGVLFNSINSRNSSKINIINCK